MPALSALPDRALAALAARAGLSVAWVDAFGTPQRVAPDTLRALLGALGIEDADALARVPSLPPLVPVDAARPLLRDMPAALARRRRVRVALEFGGTVDGVLVAAAHGLRLDRALPPGYHTLEIGGAHTTLAAAPPRCFAAADAFGTRDVRAWGVAAQLYALRGAGDRGVGDFAAVAELARAAAPFGAAAIALSPVHAMFAARPQQFSPYSPSNRCWYNTLHADAGAVASAAEIARAARAAGVARELDALRRTPWIEWPRVAAAQARLFEALFARFESGALGGAAAFAAFRAAAGNGLAAHATFEALRESRAGAGGLPLTVAEAHASGSRAFAHTHARQITYQAWRQWITALSFDAAQQAARGAGMALGLIADIAVGVDPDGSECWTRPRAMLPGARIGAPPDALNALGQNWGLTTYSPFALAPSGYAAWLEVLRASLRHAGGVRIDHVMSLFRLWLIPAGADARAGAYLAYPSADLLRLTALESWRHRAIVIGEDLGTVPPQCRRTLARAGVLGLDVLPFMRDAQDFLPAARWRRSAVAMTSTHDLPPLAGWWRGVDLDWRSRLALFGESDEAGERRERSRQRTQLARLLGRGARGGTAPAVVDAAIDFVAATPAPLAVIPLEDLTGAREAPNLPGTIAQHPNWRRRYAAPAARLLAQPRVAARLRRLGRRRSPGR